VCQIFNKTKNLSLMLEPLRPGAGVTRQGVVLADLQSPQTPPERSRRAGGGPRYVWPRGGGSKRRRFARSPAADPACGGGVADRLWPRPPSMRIE
jgi:hypothetical protein